jgi:hypothetical protein
MMVNAEYVYLDDKEMYYQDFLDKYGNDKSIIEVGVRLSMQNRGPLRLFKTKANYQNGVGEFK